MKAKDEQQTQFWRDNIEAITVSIVIIVLFKYFVLEAYKIPTGSMQPTLMGWDDGKGGGVYDRVLVDKFSYHYRDPDRFEIVVFRYPLDTSKNFIKRIVGVGPEVLELRNGDLFRAESMDSPFEVVRRPKPVQRAQLKRLSTAGEWRLQGDGWTSAEQTIGGPGPGSASYPRTTNYIRDLYTDGYPGKLVAAVRAVSRPHGSNPVGDVRVQGTVSATAGCTAVRLELNEDKRKYLMVLPGPAASADARPSIEVHDGSGEIENGEVFAQEPWRLPPGSAVDFGAQNIDDLLELEVDGKVILEKEIGSAVRQTARVTLVAEGAGVEFDDVEIYRDIYYISRRQRTTQWEIPDGSYVMLGDNTQDSADSRDWNLIGFEVEGEDGATLVRCNNRGTENPTKVYDSEGSVTVFLHDEVGERWTFPLSSARELDPVIAPFVPRALIRGRAVLVVWPMVPSLQVYRLKWVR